MTGLGEFASAVALEAAYQTAFLVASSSGQSLVTGDTRAERAFFLDTVGRALAVCGDPEVGVIADVVGNAARRAQDSFN